MSLGGISGYGQPRNISIPENYYYTPYLPYAQYGPYQSIMSQMGNYGTSIGNVYGGPVAGGGGATGGYNSDLYKRVAAAAPLAPAVVDSTTRGGGGGGRQSFEQWSEKNDPNAWKNLTSGEQANWYAEHPTFGSFTQGLQKVWGYTIPGMIQNYLDPGIGIRANLIAQGIDPRTGANMNFTPEQKAAALSAIQNTVAMPGSDAISNIANQYGMYNNPNAISNSNISSDGGFNPISGYSVGPAVSAPAPTPTPAVNIGGGEFGSWGGEERGSRGGDGGGGGYSGAPSAGSDVGRSAPGSAHYAKGGHVNASLLSGPDPMGPDQGYGALKGGEYVINDKAVKKYGIELMDAINSGKISKGKLRGLLEM